MNMAVFRVPSRQTMLNCSFPCEQINDNEINYRNILIMRALIIFFLGLPAEFPPLCIDPLCFGNYLFVETQFTSSSARSALFASRNVRLHSAGCWAPSPTDTAPWIEINVRWLTLITQVATQGRPDIDEWVTQYTIKSRTSQNDPYRDFPTDGNPKVRY